MFRKLINFLKFVIKCFSLIIMYLLCCISVLFFFFILLVLLFHFFEFVGLIFGLILILASIIVFLYKKIKKTESEIAKNK